MKGKPWIRWVLLGLLLIALGALGWGTYRLWLRGYLPFHRQVPDQPAPTSIPLPTPSATPAPSATLPGVTVTLGADAPLEAATTTPTPYPTRVLSPAEPLRVPEGFGVSIFAQGLSNPRMMEVGPDGNLYVAERGAQRIIRLPDRDRDGLADGIEVAAIGGMEAPSSLAFFHDGSLYVGDTRRILRFFSPGATGLFEESEVLVDGLPGSEGHSTRTVLFSPDYQTLFVSIGSSCNVCMESDLRRATIMRYDADGDNGRIFARGLRNAVGITFRPGTQDLWATVNGRDWLGDDQPPETLYMVREGDDAGWPGCHAGRIVDPDFGNTGSCDGILLPVVELQAHSAPIGLVFYTGLQFPESYVGDLFVAFRGSWNRTEPTGYKIVHIPFENGQPGPVQDFAVGWLRPDGSSWGRPADVEVGTDGALYVSEDRGGIIYRIFFGGE
ncbi:MAG: PQQ-dependent sugar dehydrogenase [Anaerolineae bacterium]|nr:PQQ-dependent sugar dehydrogenase [Anaerolineae bacterium]